MFSNKKIVIKISINFKITLLNQNLVNKIHIDWQLYDIFL